MQASKLQQNDVMAINGISPVILHHNTINRADVVLPRDNLCKMVILSNIHLFLLEDRLIMSGGVK